MAGLIYLYSHRGELVTQLAYSKPFHRKQIIENWRKMYGPKFNECYIQIAPETNVIKVHPKTGVNQYRNRLAKKI